MRLISNYKYRFLITVVIFVMLLVNGAINIYAADNASDNPGQPGGGNYPGWDYGGGSSGSNDSGNGEAGSGGVSEEQLAYEAALDALTDARECLESLDGLNALEQEAAVQRVNDANDAVENEYTALSESLSGDPVLVVSGRYLLQETDITIPGSEFEIIRKYVSEEGTMGNMGAGWFVSIDSRIIRGTTAIDEEMFKKMQDLVNKINALRGKIKQNYPRAKKIYDRITDEIYLPAKQKLDDLLAFKSRGEELAALNKFSKFPGAPEFFEGTGNDSLVLIDEGGSPEVFEPVGDGVWKPVNNPERLYKRLESLDGKGADSRAGFILFDRGGIKKEYNGDGLLVKVTELSGAVTEFKRDGNGSVIKILGPHGNEWNLGYTGNSISEINGPEGSVIRYGYNGNDLAWIQDNDGDTVRFRYSSGRLEEIKKPDGSVITIKYGYIGADGMQLVTTTTHEEGASEKFEYNPFLGTTLYTNHSGVKTLYKYDENHRTVREEHSDGRIKTFIYNDEGQLEAETSNGFAVRYSYDSRGNITEKAYSDGTREVWEWNGNDQRTRYIDRDKVVTDWIYDNRWNCTEVKRANQTIYTAAYDGKNRLIRSREGDRAEIHYAYDGRDYLKSRTITLNGNEIKELWETDELGRVVKYTDAIGCVWEYVYKQKEIKEKTPAGLENHYEYNSRKDLIRKTEKDLLTGEERINEYEYDKRHLPVKVTDGAGNITEYEYREDGELIRKEQGSWYWEYGYEAGGRINSVTSGKSGSTERYTEKYEYTRNGWIEEWITEKPGAVTTAYQLNAFGQVTGVTNALGEKSTRTLNGAGNITREQANSGGFYVYSYDGFGRPIEAGREGEKAIQAVYNRDGSISKKTDRTGNVTQYVYDGRGLVTREITAGGEERYTYDNSGRVIKRETLSRNNSVVYSTQWLYNDAQRTVTVTSGGIYTETLYLNAWNEVIRRVDGEGNERRFEYDRAGRLVKAIDGYGHSTKYEWNSIGKIAKIDYINNTTEQFDYDHLGNLKEIKDSLGIVWVGEHDEAGRLIKETGRPGIEKEYKYDKLGRITEVKSGGEVVEKYQYTNRGREISFITGTGGAFMQNRNAYGELTDERNRLGDSRKYSYDPEGKIIANNAFSGKQTKAEYREAEGITITTFSDGTQSIIEKDKMGNLIRVTNETGTIRYRYDAGGRLIEQNDEGAGEVTRYSYNKAGMRIRMQSGNRDIQYRYGKNSELLRVIDQSQRLEVNYEYDMMGCETRRIFGNGVRQETFYDETGRVVLIREVDSGNRLLRAEGYLNDKQGRRSHSVDEEGRVTKYEYDHQSRLSVVLYPWTKEKADADRKEAEEAGLFFTSDKGNGERYNLNTQDITALRDILNKAGPARGNTITGNQLMWRESYSYDPNGNRASKTTPWGIIKYEYDAENRLIRKGDILFTNDKDGNTLGEKGLRYEASYEYNGQNRMVYSGVINHTEKRQEQNWYGYDGLGRRTITESVTGQGLRTLYDGKGFEVIREGETFKDGSLTTRYAAGSTIAAAERTVQSNQATGERYRWLGDGSGAKAVNEEGYSVQNSRYGIRGVTLYGNGEAVAVNYSSGAGTRSMYLGKDIMGSIRSMSAETGRLEDRYEYDVFGHPYKGDLSGGMNLGYTGKPYDTSTGLYNYGYRDYKPQAARFTTMDPIRDGRNWFTYVNNDPVNWRDPWGLSASDNDGTTIQAQVAYDPNDYHCDIIAYNGLLSSDYDPRGQDGTAWNGNDLTVPQIFDQHYPENRTDTPQSDTGGYVFSEFDANGNPGHMEQYDYSDGGDTYTRYVTNGINDAQATQENPTEGRGRRVFVSVPRLSPNGNDSTNPDFTVSNPSNTSTSSEGTTNTNIFGRGFMLNGFAH